MKKHAAAFVLFILMILPGSVSGQGAVLPESGPFHCVLWPGSGSVLDASGPAGQDGHPLLAAWNNSHLLAYTGSLPAIVPPNKDRSLENYMLALLSEPECIEGDALFVEEEINKNKRLYYPLLQETGQDAEPSPLRGEIVFLNTSALWQGSLGVVHPRYSIGGKFQIERWKKETGTLPQTVTLFSPQEALRHLMVGSIQAAAVPKGALETFLRKHGRQSLLDQFIRIEIAQSAKPPVIFLRHDLYAKSLTRTLIRETWLRDNFQPVVLPLPVMGPRG